MTTPTDPKIVESIMAEFREAVREAATLAIARMLGEAPPPRVNHGNIVNDNSIEHGGVGGWNR